jgi:riboflavin kinase/FMN adenylyltransferase|tara:strand:- start:152 stop:541 length:390 start_codon:yes stop_codon:yes gene_type:complete
MEQSAQIEFTASAISGAGRGKEYGIPTININLASVPEELEEGIYACFVEIEDDPTRYMGAMHYGPRPVFQDSRACEIHLLDANLSSLPASATVSVVQYLREIKDFPSVDALKEQILDDIERCRAILGDA